MLVEKIFDLAFMPAMNGKSGCPSHSGAWGHGPSDYWLVGYIEYSAISKDFTKID